MYRFSNTDFTRMRKLSFSRTLLLMINRITKSLSVEIDNFIRVMQQTQVALCPSFFTKSAFVQCRNKIKAEVFTHLSLNLINEFYTDNEDSVKLWRGFRLLAVDGTHLTLPNTRELQNKFGTAKNQSNVILTQARASVLYDVLNCFVIDSKLSSLSISERKLAMEHLNHSQAGDLILYDRGYPSFEMIYEHKQKSIDFLFRVKLGFNNQVKAFAASDKQTDYMKIYPPMNAVLSAKQYSKDDFFLVRLNKVTLPDGTIEVLMSSLLDLIKYENKLFKELYFKRWKVETFYDELKNKLKVMDFSGYSVQSICQDFYSTIFVSNIQTLFVGEINDELRKKKGQAKYYYKVNVNVSYGILKNRILEIFFSNEPIEKISKQIKELLRQHTIPIRPDRQHRRICGKYRRRTKPNITKNQKDAL